MCIPSQTYSPSLPKDVTLDKAQGRGNRSWKQRKFGPTKFQWGQNWENISKYALKIFTSISTCQKSLVAKEFKVSNLNSLGPNVPGLIVSWVTLGKFITFTHLLPYL